MDRKIRRVDQAERVKNERKIDVKGKPRQDDRKNDFKRDRYKKDFDKNCKPKDRGDSIRKEDKQKITQDTETQVNAKNLGDRGDSPRRKILTKEKTDHISPKNADSRRSKSPEQNSPKHTEHLLAKNQEQPSNLSEKHLRMIFDKVDPPVAPLTIGMRRRLAERYTFRMKTDRPKSPGPPNLELKSKMIVNNDMQNKLTDENKTIENKSCTTQTAKKIEKVSEKKPIIKTISCKSDPTKLFKAVTFAEPKKRLSVRLNMISKIRPKTPEARPKMKNAVTLTMSKSRTNLESSKTSVKTKSFIERKQRLRRNRPSSPDICAKSRSPTTEVAKWAPFSVTGLTQPYYEAWVNTTLTAISLRDKNCSTPDKMKMQQILQKAVEDSAEEVTLTDFTDKRFSGKIVINSKGGSNRFG